MKKSSFICPVFVGNLRFCVIQQGKDIPTIGSIPRKGIMHVVEQPTNYRIWTLQSAAATTLFSVRFDSAGGLDICLIHRISSSLKLRPEESSTLMQCLPLRCTNMTCRFIRPRTPVRLQQAIRRVCHAIARRAAIAADVDAS